MNEKTSKSSNSLLSGFFHIGLGTMLNMIIGFFTTPIITRIVVPSEYGRLSIFTMYINISIMVLCFGLDQALIRYYYKKKDKNYKLWLICNCSILPVIITIIFVAVFSLVINIFNIPFKLSDSLAFLSFGVVGQLLYRFATIVLRLENRNKLYSGVYVANKCIYICLSLILVLFTDFNHYYCLAFSTVVAFMSTALFSVIKTRKIWKITSGDHFEEIKRKDLIVYGLPFIVSMGLTTLFQSIDKITLDYFCDYSTVGVYTSAMTIVSVFAIVQTTFNAMWAPMMVRHFEESPEDKLFYTKYNSYITVIMFAFGFSLVLFKDIFGLLLGAKYREAAYIVPFLVLEPIMLTVSETTVIGIVVKNKSYMNILVAFISCLVNAIGNIMLVPLVGAKGAAISTGLAYIVFFLARTLIAGLFYKVDCRLFRFLIVTILMILFALLNTFSRFSVWNIVLYLICIVVVIVLYFDSVKSLLQLFVSIIKKAVKNKQT